MTHRSSFSQHSTFEKCPRMWYFQQIRKIPVLSDMCNADAGDVVHKTLQFYYNNKTKTMDEVKVEFNRLWQNKKLDESKLKSRKDEYWLMVLVGYKMNLDVTSTEFKIYFPNVSAYLDIVNTTDDIIIDWKTSTRTEINEKEYKQQLMLYAYLYNLKFNRLPKKCVVYYLKHNGSKGEYILKPTEKELIETEDWFYNILTKMESIKNSKVMPDKCNSCYIFCPYKNLCEDNVDALKYTLHLQGNYIFVDGVITELLHKGLIKRFSYELKNSYFIKKNNPFARTKINFWDLHKRLLPIGFLQQLINILKTYGDYKKKEIIIDIHENRQFMEDKVNMPDKFISNVQLRDYQSDAVDSFIRNKIGILEIGTGGGKTEIAIEIIRRLGVKTLFVVDKIELLRQTKERIEKNLGIEVGMIGAGKNDIKNITVATVQTLSKNLTEFSGYLKDVRFVIFDETHKVSADSYWKLGHHLPNTEYRLGISGTAFRDDGNDMMITATTGDKIFDLGAKTLIERGWLTKPNIKFIKNYLSKEEISMMEDKCKTGLINESMDYANYYSVFITNNVKRNNIITEIVRKNEEKKVLILTKLIDHGQIILNLIPGSKHLYGETNKEERKQILDDFKEGKLNVLISTISIFSEGIDIPTLDIVINAGANKGDVKSIQMLGRVLRKIEGKKDAFFYDFIDESKFFKLASLARKKAFIREGHDVEVEEWK